MSSRHTPFPESEAEASTSRPRPRGAYRADGVGAIYGKNVHSIADPIKDLRRAVNYLPQAWQKVDDASKGIVREKVYSDWDRDGNPRAGFSKRRWEDDDKPKPQYFKSEEKRRKTEPVIKDDLKLMLVRMIEDGWEELTWATSVSAKVTPKNDGSGSAARSNRIRTASATAMVDDLINATFRPANRSSSPAPTSSPPSEPAIPQVKRSSHNPFRKPSSTPSATGVRPLSQSQFQRQSLSQASDSTEGFGFPTSQKAKRFGGAATEEKKRAGMRMFTVKR